MSDKRMGKIRHKIVHVQTLLSEQELIKLKVKAREPTTKEAVRKAVLHYLRCNET